MTHGIHNAEQYRGHAEAVVRDDINSLSTPEQRTVYEAYRLRIDTISSASNIEKNKLRLAIYANLIDSDIVGNIIDEREWILDNMQATQVLINQISNGALQVKDASGNIIDYGEDGILGPVTQRCIRDLFGLHIPITARPTPVVVPASGAVTTSPRPVPRPIDGDIEIPEGGVIISPELLANDELMRRIREAGITINGNRAEVENPRMLEHFEEYLDLLNFIEDVPRESSDGEISGIDNKNKLIDNYVKLINEGTDFLTEDLKEVLKYKYAEAIYNDVIRMGGYITEVEDGTTGEYTITDIRTGEVMEDNPYMRVLRESNTRNLLDVAMVISMVRKNHSLNEAPIVGDASLIKGLLEQHEIKDASGLQIIEARLLLLNKDLVLTQIEEKIIRLREGGNASAQAFQELDFLKRYVEKGETPRVNYMRTILTQVNEYKGFLDHQATIDGDWDTADFAHASEEDMTDRIASAIKGNKLGLIVIGIIAWLMGYKKVALGTLGLGIFSGTVGDIIHGAGKAALTDTDLELVRIGDVNYTLENDTYQAGYQALAERNRANTSQVIDSNNTTLPVISNDTLFNMVNDITQDDLGISIESDISDIVTQIQTKYTNTDGTPKYTREEIEAFIALIKQGETPEGATTISDYLIVGENLLTQAYSPKDFTVDPVFNTALNDHFLARWDVNSPSASITRDQARNGREDIIALIELTENTLSSGMFNGLTDSIFSLDIDKLNRGIPEQITDIRTLISSINAMSGLSDATKNPLTADNQILPNLISYLEITQELKSLDIANGAFATILSQLPPSATAAEKQERITLLNDAITKLSPSAFELNGENIDLTANPVFAALIVEINEIKSRLETEKLSIETGISREVLEGKREFIDAVTRFTTSTNEVKHIFGDNSQKDNIILLREAWTTVESGTHTPGTQEEALYNLLKPIFETGGTMETLQGELEVAFNAHYANNAEIINTRINSITYDPDDVSTINSARVRLHEVQSDYLSEFGNIDTFQAFISGNNPKSFTDSYYETAVDLFPSLNVSGTENTVYSVAEAATQKQEEIARAAFDYINNLEDFTPEAFSVLHEMARLDIVKFIDEMGIGIDVATIFGEKYAQVTNSYITSIPSTIDGIEQLEAFERNYIIQDPSIIDRINQWFSGGDIVETTFREHVATVGRTILRSSDYSENSSGLEKLLEFKSTGSEYDFIVRKYNGFEENYNARLKEIIEKIITDFPEDLEGLENLINFRNSSKYRDSNGILSGVVNSHYDSELNRKQEVVRNIEIVNSNGTFSDIYTKTNQLQSLPSLTPAEENILRNILSASIQDVVVQLELLSGSTSQDMGNIPGRYRQDIYDIIQSKNLI